MWPLEELKLQAIFSIHSIHSCNCGLLLINSVLFHSQGTAVVTQDKAVLWTDSRYWVQAERQMDCNWELEKGGKLKYNLVFVSSESSVL